MTAYHGGKQRIGKKLAEVIYDESLHIEDEYEFNIKGYCEPFAGMLGVYQHIPELFQENKLYYKAGDTNKSVILMWKKAQNGWKPPSRNITEQRYIQLKKSHQHSALKGYVGHQYSFGGQYFSGYAPKYGRNVNYNTTINRITKIINKLDDVSFSHGSYTQYSNLKGYVIYCDPPYKQTTQHYKNISFNHEKFLIWCRKMAKDNIVFISEYYTLPNDFNLIFSINGKLTGGSPPQTKTKVSRKRVEKLYVIFK
jgi:DNA adenine methylase